MKSILILDVGYIELTKKLNDFVNYNCTELELYQAKLWWLRQETLGGKNYYDTKLRSSFGVSDQNISRWFRANEYETKSVGMLNWPSQPTPNDAEASRPKLENLKAESRVKYCQAIANEMAVRHTGMLDCLQGRARRPTVRYMCNDSKHGLTHLSKDGKANMVDVGAKEITSRTAVASGKVILGPKVFKAIMDSELKKGNALDVARIAGIMAAKQTASLIPLCHNIPLSKVSIDFRMDAGSKCLDIIGTVSTVGKTGVEMEALTAVAVSALTVYDMCKALSHDIVIQDIRLERKTGGKSGEYVRGTK